MLASEPVDAPFLETLTSLRFYHWTHLWIFFLWLRFIHSFPNCVPIKSLFLECFFLWIFSGLAISSDIMASMDSSMWLTAEDVCLAVSQYHIFISNNLLSSQIQLNTGILWTYLWLWFQPTAIRWISQKNKSHEFFSLLVHTKVTFTICCSLLCVQWHYV